MTRRKGHTIGLGLLLVFTHSLWSPKPTFSQSTLSPDEVARLRQQNDAFVKASADAAPVLKRRLDAQEARLARLLGQLSDAEKNKDSALVEKLATQVGEADAEVTRLHAAQVDLLTLDKVSSYASIDLTQQNPSGQMCNGQGDCGSVPAWEAIATILTAGLVDELNKKQPFGPNNEIMKGLHAIGDFVQCIFGCK